MKKTHTNNHDSNAAPSHLQPAQTSGLRCSRRSFLAQAGQWTLIGGALASNNGWWPLSAGGSPPAPVAKDELIYRSATRLAAMIRAKEISSEELVRTFLNRIEQVNSKLNAVVQLSAERALAEAREADLALARGENKGPLHGVPFTAKDTFETAGIISTAGTLGRAAYVPTQDATPVARLRGAGAILLGKTNTPELANGYETDNRVYGRTVNPFDVGRTPGGSSGGPAAILAVGGSPLEIGSDIGGSLRVPAHYCGVTGLKPTARRVSDFGHFPPAQTGVAGPRAEAFREFPVAGPMARFVEDLILTLPLLVGPDPRYPEILDMPLGDPAKVELPGLRVAFHNNNGILAADATVTAVVQAAAAALAAIGAQVTEKRPTGIEQSRDIFNGIVFPDGGDGTRALLALAGTALSQVSPQLSPALSPAKLTDAQFESVRMLWVNYKTGLEQFMEDYDVIVCPVTPTVATAPGEVVRGSYAFPYNLSGWPAASVRCGTSASGLPIGVQIVAKHWREDIVLAVAKFLETAMGGWQPVPAPTLGLSQQSTGVRVIWKGYGTLQSSPSPEGPWTDEPVAKSPFTVPVGGTAQGFFRVRQ